MWEESKHPRDDEGKFTYKNGGEGRLYGRAEKQEKPEDILYNNTERKKRRERIEK